MNSGEARKAFDNVSDQIGVCGIWCGSCIVGNGTLRELTGKYRELITAYTLDEWGPKDFDYEEMLKGLESIENIPLCPGCLKGGGREHCEIRACAESKKIRGCHTCRGIATCTHSELLQHMRSGAIKAGLFVNTNDVDRDQLVKDWTAKLRTSWPCSILFADD